MARRRALLLEDDAALRNLLLEAFASEDIEVRTCDTFEQVRTAAAHAEADIVVADFWGGSQRTLPQSDRDDIRELCSYLPVILLTGRTWAAEVSAEELGARALVRKPFDLDDLLHAVERVVGRRQA
ncbi:MAG: response regulator [Chloroflexi bacterium]|nr:response regulator [Chloroflexota bacterium]